MAGIDGVEVKMARSLEHIAFLRTETAGFIRDHPVTFRKEHDDYPVKGWAFYAEWAQVPGRLGAIIGDALTNMRSALDHLAWQLFLRTSLASIKTNVYFPIRSTEPSPGDLATILSRVPAAAGRIVEDVQPYQNIAKKQPAEIHPLHVLKLLVNTDKHQTLTVTEMFGADSNIRVTGPGGSPVFASVQAPGGLVSDQIGWLPYQAFPTEEPWDIRARINPIRAIDTGNRQMYPIIDLLVSMHGYVQNEVIAPIVVACF